MRTPLILLALTGLYTACGDPDAGPPESPAVAAVAVTAPTTTAHPGDTIQLTATARDASGAALTDRPITWTTADRTVALVSSTGLVTALAPGEVAIAAHADGVIGAITLTVTADATPVAAVEVWPSGEVHLTPDATLQVIATLYAADGRELDDRPVGWSTSDAAVATVSSDGLVTAHAIGDAWIAATAEGQTDEMLVRVEAAMVAVARIELDAGALTLAPGDTRQVVATAYDADGAALPDRIATWRSDAPAVATVSSEGLVTAHGVGTAIITAAIEAHTAQLTLEVRAGERVVITPTTAVLDLGEQAQLVATVLDAAGEVVARPVTWSSARPTIATVDGAGVVTAHGYGAATITASIGSAQATATVTVATWAGFDLVAVGDAPLPATLGTRFEPTPAGGTVAVRYEAIDGSLAIHDADHRFTLLVWLASYRPGEAPGLGSLELAGTVTTDAAGALAFVVDGVPTYTGQRLSDGRVRFDWPLGWGGPTAAMVFAPR